MHDKELTAGAVRHVGAGHGYNSAGMLQIILQLPLLYKLEAFELYI